MKKFIAIFLVIACCVPFLFGCEKKTSTTTQLDYSATYYADIIIADYGTVTVLLNQNTAPITVTNFVDLVNKGFYNNHPIQGLKDDFMEFNGSGDGATKHIYGEFEQNGFPNKISHERGVISMSRGDKFDSAKSQFFILRNDRTDLDGRYAAFGYVIDGMDVIDAIYENATSDKLPVVNSIVIRTE